MEHDPAKAAGAAPVVKAAGCPTAGEAAAGSGAGGSAARAAGGLSRPGARPAAPLIARVRRLLAKRGRSRSADPVLDGGRWMLAVAGLIALLEVLPYGWMVLTSLMSLPEASTGALLPAEPQWGNYLEVLQAAPLGRYYLNTIIVCGSIALLQILFACTAGYAFARLRFPGRDLLFGLVLACLLIPPQVRFVPLFLLLNELHLINSYAALILPYSVSALGTFLVRQAFLAVPEDLIEAARLDGASTLRIIWHVMMPLARPTLVAFALFSVVFHWNDYFWTLVMTTDESVRTLPLGVAMLREEGTGVRWHLLMAANVLMVLPLLVVFAFAQRQIVQAFKL